MHFLGNWESLVTCNFKLTCLSSLPHFPLHSCFPLNVLLLSIQYLHIRFSLGNTCQRIQSQKTSTKVGHKEKTFRRKLGVEFPTCLKAIKTLSLEVHFTWNALTVPVFNILAVNNRIQVYFCFLTHYYNFNFSLTYYHTFPCMSFFSFSLPLIFSCL